MPGKVKYYKNCIFWLYKQYRNEGYMTDLEKYYNKFCEDKRLLRRHGQVEYITSMKYIHDLLGENKEKK